MGVSELLRITPAGLLLRHAKNRGAGSRNIRIFLLRGGLGNQLFQIAGAASLSMKHNFDVIFCDSDVKKNPRDRKFGSILELNFDLWFSKKVNVYKSSAGTNLLVRFFRSRKIPLSPTYFSQCDIDQYRPQLKWGFMQGYLQNSSFVLRLPPSVAALTFKDFSRKERNDNGIAIHIRAQDALKRKEMYVDLSYYQNALRFLHAASETKIDVYSDDLEYAKILCSEIGNYNFNFPEQDSALNPIDLLITISMYDKIISSKSTLCWWACYLSVSRNPLSIIISPWNNDLHLSAWHSIG